MKREEYCIQAAYFSFLTLHEKRHPQLRWIHASMNGASASSKAAAGMRKAAGQKKGIWDVFIPIPMGEAPGCWIEFKSATGRLTPEQCEFQKHLLASGYEFAVVRSFPEAVAVTNRYLGLSLKLF